MKHPRPAPPSDAPAGTTTIGGPLGWFSAALHVAAPDLSPAAVSQLFGVEPTESQTMGVPILRDDGSLRRVPRFGSWSLTLKSTASDEWDLNEVVNELLAKLPQEQGVWKQVARLGKLRLSLGLELMGNNQDFWLEPELLQALGERKVQVFFDIYRGDGALLA